MGVRRQLLFLLVLTAAACSPAAENGDPVASSVTEPTSMSTTSVAVTTTVPPATTSTTTTSTTTTTTTSPDLQNLPLAWTAAEAERDVENYLAALAAGAYEQAAWPNEDNGGTFSGQSQDETHVEFLQRVCADGACPGPYDIEADGPGFIDPEDGQASSTVAVVHRDSGESSVLTVGTQEGQRIVMGLPPLVPSAGEPPLVEQLFGSSVPDRIVVQRFDAFEIWEQGSVEWVTSWHAKDAVQVEGDLVTSWPDLVVDLRDPALTYPAERAKLLTRDDEVLALTGEWADNPRLVEVRTGEPRNTDLALGAFSDGEWGFLAERGGAVLYGLGDAEGNLTSLISEQGVDLAGDDYIGYLSLSVDGSMVAYVDHRDPDAHSHFWSPVLVVKDISSAVEIGRWVLDGPVLCIEFSGDWVVACEGSNDLASGSPEQAALVAINVETSELTRIETRVRVFLPS
jgi:hypothetical protein